MYFPFLNFLVMVWNLFIDGIKNFYLENLLNYEIVGLFLQKRNFQDAEVYILYFIGIGCVEL